MQEEFNQLPQIDSRLRKNILRMPGSRLSGKRHCH